MDGSAALTAAMMATALGGAGLAAFLLAKARSAPGALPLAAFLLLVGLWALGLLVPDRRGGALMALASLNTAVFVHFAVRLAGAKSPPLLWFYGAGIATTLAALLMGCGSFVPWPGVGALFRYDGVGYVAAAASLAMAAQGHLWLWGAWRASVGKRRRQIGVVMASSALGLASCSSLLLPWLGASIFPFTLLLLPFYLLGLTYAVLRYEFMAANLWARRALTWGLLATLAVAVTALPAGLLAAEGTWWLSALAVAAAMVLWLPVRRVVDGLIFPGGDLDAGEISAWRTELQAAQDEAEVRAASDRLLLKKLRVSPSDWSEAPPGPRRVINVMNGLRDEALREIARRRAFAESQRLAELGALATTVAHDLRNPMNIMAMAVANADAGIRDEVRTQIARMDALVRDVLDYAKPWTVHVTQVDVVGAIADVGRGMEIDLDIPSGITVLGRSTATRTGARQSLVQCARRWWSRAGGGGTRGRCRADPCLRRRAGDSRRHPRIAVQALRVAGGRRDWSRPRHRLQGHGRARWRDRARRAAALDHVLHHEISRMSAGSILLVDDEPAFLRLAASWLEQQGHRVATAADATAAADTFRREHPDMVILDLVMPPERTAEAGLKLIPGFATVPVVVLTAHDAHDWALRAVAAGAWDFLAKPVDPDLLRFVVSRALAKRALEAELSRLRRSVDDGRIFGRSPAILRLKEMVRRVGPADLPVLVLGPSGTGKELVAQALHAASARRTGPFVAVHCGAIPAELLESELFGHLKGSFTGAHQDRPGLIAGADGGTLFLDEVGEMPPAMQVKLLRFLQEGTYVPVGGRQQQSADVRLISATHRDVEAMVCEGTFREDFYYRLKGVILRTPALSDRREDIAPLAARFLGDVAKRRTVHLTAEGLAWLAQQDWPGNVRELKAVVESAAALADPAGGGAIGPADLAFARTGEPAVAQVAADTSSLPQAVADLERRMISGALAATGNNHSAAARRLGLSRAGLLKMMARLGLR